MIAYCQNIFKNNPSYPYVGIATFPIDKAYIIPQNYSIQLCRVIVKLSKNFDHYNEGMQIVYMHNKYITGIIKVVIDVAVSLNIGHSFNFQPGRGKTLCVFSIYWLFDVTNIMVLLLTFLMYY